MLIDWPNVQTEVVGGLIVAIVVGVVSMAWSLARKPAHEPDRAPFRSMPAGNIDTKKGEAVRRAPNGTLAGGTVTPLELKILGVLDERGIPVHTPQRQGLRQLGMQDLEARLGLGTDIKVRYAIQSLRRRGFVMADESVLTASPVFLTAAGSQFLKQQKAR